MGLPIHPVATRMFRASVNLFYESAPNSLTSCSLVREQVLQIAGRFHRNCAAVKQKMCEAEQNSRLLDYQSMHWFISIEKARPSHLCNCVRQRSLPFSTVKGVITVPKRLPLRRIAWLDTSYQQIVVHGYTLPTRRPTSCIFLGSTFCAPCTNSEAKLIHAIALSNLLTMVE